MAKSSPGPGFLMPTDSNKSLEKYMSFAQKSFVFTAKASFSQPRSSVAAMKITRLKSCLEDHGELQVLLEVLPFTQFLCVLSCIPLCLLPVYIDGPPIVFSINVAV